MIEFEKELEAKRKDEEMKLQRLTHMLSVSAPLGQINHEVEAFDRLHGRGGAGVNYTAAYGGPMSWLSKGVPAYGAMSGTGGSNGASNNSTAEFIAKYGMTAADMVEAYRLNKTKEGSSEGFELGSSAYGVEPEGGLNFNVGQRYDRDGNLITYRGPETIKFTDQQNAILDKYKKIMEERARPLKDVGLKSKEDSIKELIDYRKSLTDSYDSGFDVDKQDLADIDAEIRRLKGISRTGATVPAIDTNEKKKGFNWGSALDFIRKPLSLTTPGYAPSGRYRSDDEDENPDYLPGLKRIK